MSTIHLYHGIGNKLLICFMISICILCIIPSSKELEVVAIGDLHGDYRTFSQLLDYLNFTVQPNGMMDISKTKLIQTGDVLDRGEHGLEIIKFFMENVNNSNIEMLIGNHEQLNMFGLFHYVNEKEYSEEYKDLMLNSSSSIRKFILSRNFVSVMDGIVYVHAGILPSVIEKENKRLDLLNKAMSIALETHDPFKEEPHVSLLGDKGPLWLRDYSTGRNCGSLYKALELLGANHMVVGHQIQNYVTVKCFDPKRKMSVICIDVGMSGGYGGSNHSAIKIVDGKTLYVYENIPLMRMIDLDTNRVTYFNDTRFSSQG